MDQINVFARSLDGSLYQVFIQNLSYPCDFIRLIGGFTVRGEKPAVNHIFRHWILSPFKPEGDAIYLGDFRKEDLKQLRLWYAFDTCRSKPSRYIEGLRADMPPLAKLRTTVGAETLFVITKRTDGAELKDYMESIRFNIKDRIEELLKRYVYSLNHATAEEFHDAITNDKRIGNEHLNQLAILDFCEPYNDGVTFRQMYEAKSDTSEQYYRWFVTDFGLPEPTGAPPARLISLPMPVAAK